MFLAFFIPEITVLSIEQETQNKKWKYLHKVPAIQFGHGSQGKVRR
jgi:hypothetical protein